MDKKEFIKTFTGVYPDVNLDAEYDKINPPAEPEKQAEKER